MAATDRLLTYYGIPAGVNQLWHDDQASAFVTNRDLIIFGAGLEEPLHTYHSATRNLIYSLRSHKPTAAVFGYVDLGVTTSNHSLA